MATHTQTQTQSTRASDTTTIQHGAVTLTIPASLQPPERAGRMTPDEVRRTPKVPLGIGLICEQVADGMEKAEGRFAAPPGLTPADLAAAGQRAEQVDHVILDLEVILQTMKQANLLFDADAWDKLRQVNDQVKVQGKRNPELLAIFKPLSEFLTKGHRPTPSAPAQQGAAQE
jgi:hypothetical protein